MEWLVTWQDKEEIKIELPDDFKAGVLAFIHIDGLAYSLLYDDLREIFIIERDGVERCYWPNQSLDIAPSGFDPDEVYLYCQHKALRQGRVRRFVSGLPMRQDPLELKGDLTLVSPLVGSVLKINKSVGESVHAGETVAIIEAMKMENQIKSPIKGTLRKLAVKVGGPIVLGEAICTIERG